MENPNIATLPEVSPHLATTPVRWKRILVAIDFGDQSLRGLEEAIAIARCFHSELLLVHAASPAVYSTGMEPIAVDPIGLELGFAREEMDRLLKATPALSELQHRELIEYGNAMQLIRDIAIEHNVDLIVAGSHTTSSLERLLLGSVAESVLRTVNCPVLIIGPHAHTEANPFRSILLAAPLADTGLRCAQFACSLAEQFPARLTLLHVLKARSPLPAQALLTEENARMELARLEPDDLVGKVQTIIRVEYGDAAEVIPSVANSIEASLVVAGVSDRSPLGDHAPWSTLSHIIRDANLPRPLRATPPCLALKHERSFDNERRNEVSNARQEAFESLPMDRSHRLARLFRHGDSPGDLRCSQGPVGSFVNPGLFHPWRSL